MRAAQLAASSAVAVMLLAGGALAQAAPDTWRSTEYYVAHGAITAALLGGGAWTEASREELEAGGDTVWFPGDAGLRGRAHR